MHVSLGKKTFFLPSSLSLFQEIQSLLTNWKGPDLIGYGELVHEGTFRFQRAKNERTLFLFDKLLLITKKREETYTYKAHILVRLYPDAYRFSVMENPAHTRWSS